MLNRRLCGLAITVLLLTHPAPAEHCGGTERWQVKVGADSGVSRVELTPVIDRSVVDLNALFAVTARLVKFKLEGGDKGDRDYHLVVSDDTLKFTSHEGQNGGHSIVAEIVDPECIAGMRGDPNVPSRFIEQIRQSRQILEAKFPDVHEGEWVDAYGARVRIVGVGFFDRPHGQVGRALNNLELHPVLAITFEGTSTPAPPPTPVPATGNLLRNSGFEDGGTGWNAPKDVITKNSAIPAHGGSGKAWMCGYGESHSDTLFQQVTIPGSAQSVTLSFFLNINTEEDPDKAYDKLKLQIRDASGQWVKTPQSWSNLNSASGFVRQEINLSSFRGKTVRINFECSEDSRTITNFVLDDIQLDVNQ